MDTNAGFLKSFSYCNETDECLEDAWNYLHRNCTSGWTRGKDLDFESCLAVQIDCLNFVSSPEYFKTDGTKDVNYFNRTWTLPASTYCKVNVDATEAVGRVVFDETSYLGIEGELKLGEVLSVYQGDTQDILIYNGAEEGQLTFMISFSSARTLMSQFATFISITLLSSFAF
jgi:hypothetical protein